MNKLGGVLILVVGFLALADSAEAMPRTCGQCGMFGLARDQVARINVAHVGGRSQRPIQVEMLFVDSDGTVVGRDVQTVSPGQAVFFDAGRGEDWIELRAVINASNPPDGDKNLGISVEVFDADTGRTTVLIGD